MGRGATALATMSALDINFGRTQMMQRELHAQQDFTVAEIFGEYASREEPRAITLGRRLAQRGLLTRCTRRWSACRQADRPACQDIDGEVQPKHLARKIAR